jgi:hypothetical protein
MLGLLGIKVHDEQVEKTISVILRLPGLFLLDHWYQSSSTEIWAKIVDSPDMISAVVSPISKQEFILTVQSLLEVHVALSCCDHIRYRRYMSVIQ